MKRIVVVLVLSMLTSAHATTPCVLEPGAPGAPDDDSTCSSSDQARAMTNAYLSPLASPTPPVTCIDFDASWDCPPQGGLCSYHSAGRSCTSDPFWHYYQDAGIWLTVVVECVVYQIQDGEYSDGCSLHSP